jgi:alpha-D-xyloside xylohydrolase
MYVRAGSIIPLGPEMQYVGEQSWQELELHVYPGADAAFTLYEDEGDGYRYEQGVYSTITFRWDDRSRTLTIGDRQGSYPDMLTTRRFVIVMPDGRRQIVEYSGRELSVEC